MRSFRQGGKPTPMRRAVLVLLVIRSLLVATSAFALDRPTYLGPKPPPSPRRIVTLAPSLTETVIALGAGDRLVGVSRFDDLPEVAKLARVGGFVDPSVEAVISLKPQLVLVQPSPGNRQPVEKMAELGAPVLALPMHNIAEVLRSMREIGAALGLSDRAERLVQELERTRQSVRARARAQKPLRVLFVYGFEPLVVAGPGSFADELLKDAGAINAADKADSAYSVYSAENAVRSRADVVINAAEDDAAAEKFSRLAGLKQARWVKLPSKDLLHPGPGLHKGLEEIFALLYPGAGTAPVAR